MIFKANSISLHDKPFWFEGGTVSQEYLYTTLLIGQPTWWALSNMVSQKFIHIILTYHLAFITLLHVLLAICTYCTKTIEYNMNLFYFIVLLQNFWVLFFCLFCKCKWFEYTFVFSMYCSLYNSIILNLGSDYPKVCTHLRTLICNKLFTWYLIIFSKGHYLCNLVIIQDTVRQRFNEIIKFILSCFTVFTTFVSRGCFTQWGKIREC